MFQLFNVQSLQLSVDHHSSFPESQKTDTIYYSFKYPALKSRIFPDHCDLESRSPNVCQPARLVFCFLQSFQRLLKTFYLPTEIIALLSHANWSNFSSVFLCIDLQSLICSYFMSFPRSYSLPHYRNFQQPYRVAETSAEQML